MRYNWTEDHVLLREMIERYAAEKYSFEDRNARIKNGFCKNRWQELSQLGILGLTIDEQYGGSGFGAIETIIVAQAFGKNLVTEPFLSNVILCGGLLQQAGNNAQKEDFLPKIIDGSTVFSFAYLEPNCRDNLAYTTSTATPSKNGWILRAHKTMVGGATHSDYIIISARTSGQKFDKHGITLFLIPNNTNGLTIKNYNTIDGNDAADIWIDGIEVTSDQIIGTIDNAFEIIEKVIDEAIIANCAEAIGAMEALLARCVEHCKTREVFGQKLSNFQVIQHRIVDMHVSFEQASACLLQAAVSINSSQKIRKKFVSAAKAQISQEAMLIGKNAVQLHGAMGMTDELDIGHYFKKLTTSNLMFGSVDYHLRRFLEVTENEES